ncbi:imelysin family protein [Phaeovulum sp.]|uniref:imelysin family protein n=1 Tax=Phaeovulum sp. TaxID=2934796 RepID=UPI0039E5F1BD
MICPTPTALAATLTLLAAPFLPAPAHADVAEAVTQNILPGYAGFAKATAALSDAAAADCTPAALRPAWNDAFDAWLSVVHLRLGPVEVKGRALAIAYWPDPKAIGARQLAEITAAANPALTTPEGMAQVSVAAKGFFGLERLLYGPDYGADSYDCALTRAMTKDLAATAAAVTAEWGSAGSGGYADLLLTAGQPENLTFLTIDEARQALFTQLITGIEFVKDQRLGRPLGTFEKPRPERAEALASGRPLHNVVVSLDGLNRFADALGGPAPLADAAFAHALTLAKALPEPTFQDVTNPAGRLKVEILQQAVAATAETTLIEIGATLGVSVGFNAADGD